MRVDRRTGRAFDSIVRSHKGTPVPPDVGRLLKKRMRRFLIYEVRPLLFDMTSSRKSHAVLAAGSRLEALFLKAIDEKGASLSEVEEWEPIRDVRLPWVKDLSVSEVLELKQEASLALPRLRELLAKRLSMPTGESGPAIKELVRELRDEAESVQAELAAWAEGGGRRLEREIAALGLSLVLYGLIHAGANCYGPGRHYDYARDGTYRAE